MRRIVIWIASTVTVVVLLFGYHTSTSSTTPLAVSSSASSTPEPSSSSPTSTPSSTRSNAPSSTPSSEPSASTTTANATKTYTGDVADTRWGPVQVEITVVAAKVTNVDVVQYPNGNGRDAEINDYALPILVQETIKEQSANIDMVSGATVTSDGYLQSLQAALDAAGL